MTLLVKSEEVFFSSFAASFFVPALLSSCRARTRFFPLFRPCTAFSFRTAGVGTNG